MNRIHNLICSSARWRARVEHELLPWGLEDVELGERVLELGPGFGATTSLLAARQPRLEVLELDEVYCERLRDELGDRVVVTRGDATQMPYRDATFSAVICFTMLHHIPAPELQDQAFSEIARVLQPGGTFAGTDSLGTGLVFKLIHLGDTRVPVDPGKLSGRLRAAGLQEPLVQRLNGTFRFRARKPR